MPDYKKGKIYKIVSNSTDKVYYGGTAQILSKRFSNHKSGYKKWIKDNTSPYTSSYEIIKHEDARIILVEKYSCNDKDEIRARERYYIENNSCVNKTVPIRFSHETYGLKKQYRESHKIEIRVKKKQEYLDNEEKIRERSHDRYHSDKKDEILQKQKKHRDENREEINRKQNAQREANKDEINRKRREKYNSTDKDKISQRNKNWRENNKDKLKASKKEYRERNKEKIKKDRDDNKDEINRRKREIRAIKKDRLFYIKLLPLGF